MYVDLRDQYEIDKPGDLAIKGIVKKYSRIVFKNPEGFSVWAPKPVQPHIVEFEKCNMPTTYVVYTYGDKDYIIVYHPKAVTSHVHVFPQDPREELSPSEAKTVAVDFISKCLQKGVARRRS